MIGNQGKKYRSKIGNSPRHQVGRIGPAGGYIFYDKLSYSDGWRYMEAAPVETEFYGKVYGGSNTLIGTTLETVGSGYQNTLDIYNKLGDVEPWEGKTDYAAKICLELTHNGFSDFFLPSIDELLEINTNLYLKGLGGFSDDPVSGIYWSSSEYDAKEGLYARVFLFNNQDEKNRAKDTDYFLTRAVRRF